MAKRKTQFMITFYSEPQVIYNIISGWLNANGFVIKDKKGMQWWQSGNGVFTAAKCFEYYIQGNQLLIFAYLRSPKNPFPLDNGLVGAVNTMPYMSKIEQLINAIKEQENQNVQVNQQLNMQYQSAPYPQYDNTVMTFDKQGNVNPFTSIEAQNDKTKGACAILALVLSLLSVVGAYFGYIHFFVIIVAYCLAISGFKSSKRILSIAALVAATVAVAVFFIKLVSLS